MTAPEAAALPVGCFTDPGRPLTFKFEGRTIRAIPGQSIAAALYAAGVRIFSRSFKYHRPRGLLCVSGDCPNCLMQVDGRPNVRTCIEPARQGQVVRGQHAWPGLRFDLLRVFDRLSYFLPVGFYYKRFHKPRWLWPIFERVVRSLAGLGQIDVSDQPTVDTTVEHLHAEVCVIGGGPAGLSAAAAAAQAGADVVLVERMPQLGGHLLFEGQAAPILESLPLGKVRVLLETTAFGLYEENLVGAFAGDRMLKIRAGQMIVCTGGRQRPFLFRNNDLPGIFLGRGALRLARLYGVLAGQRTVVETDNDDGHRLAESLIGLGMQVAAVIDHRPAAAPISAAYPILAGRPVLRARGRSCLRAVQVTALDGTSVERTIPCDVLCLAPRLTPANELLHQGGMRFAFQEGRWMPSRSVPGVQAAGAAAGTFGPQAHLREGRMCGQIAARALGYAVSIDDGSGQTATVNDSLTQIVADSVLPPGKCFVCLCEDVTVKDVDQAVAEGFDHLETLKRYSTVGMGPCQGKMCGQTFTEICARLTNQEVGVVGTTTSRPPTVPVELAVLAAGRRHEPVRRTPMHHWHQGAGVRWLDAGQWKRPESYGDPAAEVRAVRTAVGLIDVSTLGKFELVGPDAAELLERVYLNSWADLAVGRARYGVMCTEEGIVFDDGVGGRLARDHFYLTATTGNADAVFQWLELWRTTWRMNVTILNRTAAFAAMNLAGPHARQVLGRLTEMDLSPLAFPYPAVRQGEVAGVPCRLLRVGFVGELGYEIHCPSSHAWHLWEAILEAGSASGSKPFGVEAQRILRLEKGHLIVGQDTDALSDPFGAGLGRMVRFAKPQFLGRESLLRFKDMHDRLRLIGFVLPDGVAPKGDRASQVEGCQVVEQGRPVGRVTSTRFSPTLAKTIGLAWVPQERAKAGQRFLVRCNGVDMAALATAVPFYDPQGERLKN
jgi:sarcosine oxidase subunit alpha